MEQKATVRHQLPQMHKILRDNAMQCNGVCLDVIFFANTQYKQTCPFILDKISDLFQYASVAPTCCGVVYPN